MIKFASDKQLYMKKILLLVFLNFLICSAFVHAQNKTNRYNIDDRLYKIYERGLLARGKQNCLQIADSMYMMSIRYGDKKAQCLAKTLTLSHYFSKRDIDNVKIAAKACRDISKRNNYLQYYYFAYNEEVMALLNKALYSEALQVVQDMYADAQADNYNYGKVQCLNSLAHIYHARQNYPVAEKYYKETIQAIEKEPSTSDSKYSAISQLAVVQYEQEKYEEALENALKCTGQSIQDNNTILAKCLLPSLYFFLNNTDKIKPAIADINLTNKSNSRGAIESYIRQNSIIQKLLDGQNEEVLTEMAKAKNGLNPKFVSRIYEYLGDYKRAYSTLTKQYAEFEKQQNNLISNDVNAYSSKLGYDRLALQNAEQALQLSESEAELKQTQLKNANLELNSKNLELSNQNLELTNKNLELDREREKANFEAKELMHEKEMSVLKANEELLESQHKSLQQWAIIGIMALLLFATAIIGVMQIRSRRRLEKKNEQLRTARKEAEKQREIAERANQYKTAFIQNMSHEVRTPLNAICGFSQLLSNKDIANLLTDEERENYGEIINSNTEMLTTLVNDILDLGEIENNTYRINKTPMFVNEICRKTMKTVEHRLMGSQVQLLFDSKVEDNFEITSDPARIQQILVNFLTNAIKHTQEGSITLSVRQMAENHIQFSVTDTGEGIPEGKEEAIFERFEKLNNFKQGTGLGLAICRSLATGLGGRVYVDTKYAGPGAKFNLEL